MSISVELQSVEPDKTWLKNPLHCLSLGFGCGLSPLMPGTVGTLPGVVVYLLMMNLNMMLYLSITLLIIGIGAWVADYTSVALGGRDHKAIVVDEIVGFLVACIGLPTNWFYLVSAFILFRIFDIAKPWPISFIDKQIKGGAGIVSDDLVAGIYTLLCIQATVFIMSL